MAKEMVRRIGSQVEGRHDKFAGMTLVFFSFSLKACDILSVRIGKTKIRYAEFQENVQRAIEQTIFKPKAAIDPISENGIGPDY